MGGSWGLGRLHILSLQEQVDSLGGHPDVVQLQDLFDFAEAQPSFAQLYNPLLGVVIQAAHCAPRHLAGQGMLAFYSLELPFSLVFCSYILSKDSWQGHVPPSWTNVIFLLSQQQWRRGALGKQPQK